MGRRLAMFAVEGEFTSQLIRSNQVERQIRVTGGHGAGLELQLVHADGEVKNSDLIDGLNSLPSMANVLGLRVLKRIASGEPTTVEVIY